MSRFHFGRGYIRNLQISKDEHVSGWQIQRLQPLGVLKNVIFIRYLMYIDHSVLYRSVILEFLFAVLPHLDSECLILGQSRRSTDLCNRHEVLEPNRFVSSVSSIHKSVCISLGEKLYKDWGMVIRGYGDREIRIGLRPVTNLSWKVFGFRSGRRK